jgi:ubiquinone/menaquinone biosynthesis C-methylase UbiE
MLLVRHSGPPRPAYDRLIARMEYVHGYSDSEESRLRDQADTLAGLLHEGTVYPNGVRVLEAGCGVGAQTVHLAANSPGATFTCIDVSEESLAIARKAVQELRLSNVHFQQADLFDLPFAQESFDHAFVCFVLEHLREPVAALKALRAVVKPGGSITVIEGDHGSSLYYPPSRQAWATIQCLIDLQASAGGNALIGRSLYPILRQSGLRNVKVVPRIVYADASRPEWVGGFTRKTFIAMVEGVKAKAISSGLISQEEWERGIADLKKTAQPDGTFSYTFYKGVGLR